MSRGTRCDGLLGTERQQRDRDPTLGTGGEVESLKKVNRALAAEVGLFLDFIIMGWFRGCSQMKRLHCVM